MSKLVSIGERVACPYCKDTILAKNYSKHLEGNSKCIERREKLEREKENVDNPLALEIMRAKAEDDWVEIDDALEEESPKAELRDENKNVPKKEAKENKCRIRNGCWTLKADGWDHLEFIENLNDPEFSHNIRYVVFQLEVGIQGYLHFQGYIELKQQMTISALKTKIFHSDVIHLSSRKGSSDQAAHYCLKPVEVCSCSYCKQVNPLKLDGPCICEHCRTAREQDNNGLGTIDGKPFRFEWGERSGSTHSEIRDVIVRRLLEGENVEKLMIEFPEYTLAHHAGMRALANAIENEQRSIRSSLRVFWFFGWPGAGKTYLAKKEAGPGYYPWPKGSSKPNGYRGERSAIIEEWNPTMIDVDSLKCLLDKEETATFDTKYRATGIQFCPEVIIITSNRCPWDMIREPFDRIAICRRLTGIIGFTKPYHKRDPKVPSDGTIVLSTSDEVDPLIEWIEKRPDTWM